MPIHDWTRLDSGIFHDFHNMWLIALRNAIKHTLPPGYSVMTEQRTLDYEVDVLALQTEIAGSVPPDCSMNSLRPAARLGCCAKCTPS